MNSEKKTCNRCNTEKELSEFRVHKSKKGTYVLNQCKCCESLANNARRNKVKTIKITTKNGREFEASLTPIPGGRKASSVDTSVILYFAAGVKRDEARCAFAKYANLKGLTGISTPIV